MFFFKIPEQIDANAILPIIKKQKNAKKRKDLYKKKRFINISV